MSRHNGLIIETNEHLFPGKEKETEKLQYDLLIAAGAAKDIGLTEEQFLEWARAYYQVPGFEARAPGKSFLAEDIDLNGYSRLEVLTMCGETLKDIDLLLESRGYQNSALRGSICDILHELGKLDEPPPELNLQPVPVDELPF